MRTLSLAQALALPQPLVAAFVGAGGKSRAMFTLAEALAPPVLMTTTTHLALEQASWAEEHLALGPDDDLPAQLPARRLLLTGPRQGDRWSALPEALWPRLLALARDGVPLLVEADGAARKPLKAPEEHEPALPPGVTAVVTVAGLDPLGHPPTAERVHRLPRFLELAGLTPDDPITPQVLARVLSHPQGGRKGIPEDAAWHVLLVAETDEALAWGRPVAEALWKHRFGTRVVVARGHARRLEPRAVFAPVAGIVLAAGPSHRMQGQVKVLLPVEGEPMVRRVARTALLAGLDPVVVVVGHEAEAVSQALADLPVRVVHNPHWAAGQSTSVRAGVEALPPEVGAAVFLLADMPLVTPTLVQALVDVHARTLAPIVAPMVDQRRGNPVLFDRSTFADLLALQGDVGGRFLLQKHRVLGLPWFDETTQLDVDTPEDYQRVLQVFLQ